MNGVHYNGIDSFSLIHHHFPKLFAIHSDIWYIIGHSYQHSLDQWHVLTEYFDLYTNICLISQGIFGKPICSLDLKARRQMLYKSPPAWFHFAPVSNMQKVGIDIWLSHKLFEKCLLGKHHDRPDLHCLDVVVSLVIPGKLYRLTWPHWCSWKATRAIFHSGECQR